MGKSEREKVTLVSRFSALGDVAMTLPLLYNVARSHPERRFLMLTRKQAAPLFINAPENLTVEGVDLEAHGKPVHILALCADLRRRYEIDSYADLHDVIRTKLMRLYFRLHGVRVAAIDKMRAKRKALTRRHGKTLTAIRPVQALYADVFDRLGISRQKSFTSLFGADGAPADDLRPILPEGLANREAETWIAIAPFARHPGKIYPGKSMLKIIDHFAARNDCRVFLLGAGPEETEKLRLWAAGRENVVNVAEARAGFPAELALLSHCDVLLSMDSANMHLASLAGCPVVSVWGATHPYAGFYGRGQKPENAVQLALPCRPCSIYGNKPCFRHDYLCLTGISPDLIINRLKRVCALSP